MAHITIEPIECEIGDKDTADGKFWQMQFVDPVTGDVADIVCHDRIFTSFLRQFRDIANKMNV